MSDVEVKKHIIHTNNTLILGVINGNPSQGVPSLASAITGKDNWDEVIKDIYCEDDSKRLVVDNINDVTRVFNPTYFFRVVEENVDGVPTLVVEHTLKHCENALPVEITRESLCYQVLERKGHIKLSEVIDELRKKLGKARDHYLAATKTRNPKALKEQEDVRRNFISCLTEPVVAYLLATESCRNYTLRQDDPSSEELEGKKIRTYDVAVPCFETGTIKMETIEVVVPEEREFSQEEEAERVKARIALENDVRLGRKALSGAVAGYLRSATKMDDIVDKNKKDLVKALIETGIAAELMLDDITEKDHTNVKDLLSAEQKRLLEENPQILLTAGAEESEAAEESETVGDEEVDGEKESKSENASVALANIKDDPSHAAVMTQKQAKRIRESLESERLMDHVQTIETAALQYYGDDEDKERQICAYLHTLTPVGQIQNKMALIRKQRRGTRKLRGKVGFELYLDMCLEEATQKSLIVKKFRNVIEKALLNVPHEVDERKVTEAEWQRFHDYLLQTAKATFEDYMANVSPAVTMLMGIDSFMKTTSAAKKSRPQVLIANTSAADLRDDDDLRGQFEKFANALNSYNQEEFERAISIVIVPRLESFEKEKLFGIGFKEGFQIFFSPEETFDYNRLRSQPEVTALRELWESESDITYQCGVLCTPDNVLIPADFTFSLGEFYGTKKSCCYMIDEPIAIPACFDAAALVARNDDTRFVQEALKGNGIRMEPRWPSLGMPFGDARYEGLWQSGNLSEGVIHENRFEEPLPFCVFEHSTAPRGKRKRQKIRFLNTLHVLGGQPVPLFESRVAKYLNRALRLNYPMGTSASSLDHFTTTFKGIHKSGFDNSVLNKEKYELNFNKKSGYFGIRSKGQDVDITGFECFVEERSEDESS